MTPFGQFLYFGSMPVVTLAIVWWIVGWNPPWDYRVVHQDMICIMPEKEQVQ